MIAYFKEVLPDYDEDRVYPSDIKKVLNWYNMLQAKGLVSKEAPVKQEVKSEEVKSDDVKSEVEKPVKKEKTEAKAEKTAAAPKAPKSKEKK